MGRVVEGGDNRKDPGHSHKIWDDTQWWELFPQTSHMHMHTRKENCTPNHIITSHLVDFFAELDGKVRGQNSNRNTFKQTAEYAQKITGDGDAASITSLVPGVKNSRPWNCLELDRTQKVYYGRSRTKWFRLIMNISHLSRDLAWLRGGTTDVINACTWHFFAVCLTVFLCDASTSDLHRRILWKKNLSDQSLWFGVQFSFQTKMKTMCIDKIPFNQVKQNNICFLLGYVHNQESRFVNDK